MRNVIVVGGGIAGMISALLYSKKGMPVILIEKEENLGGLLYSKCLFEENLFFDCGTHFLRETGNQHIDSLIFKNLKVEKFDYLKVGSYYKGLNEKNGFLSSEFLDAQSQFSFFEELKAASPLPKYNHLENQLIGDFGKGFGQLLEKTTQKFFHAKANKLTPNSHHLFGLSRIIAGTAEETRELKKIPRFNNVLAYHSYKEGLSKLKSMYPLKSGTRAWIASLEKTLLEQNVKIIKRASISNIEIQKNKVENLTVNNTKIDADKLIWTIPPFLLLKELGLKLNTEPPKRLTSCIIHFLVDEAYLTDLFFLHCYDSELMTFRVTLYDNYCSGISGKYRVTSEILLKEPPKDLASIEKKAFEELVVMKILPNTTNVLKILTDVYPNGFPVLTTSFMEASVKQYETLTSHLTNVEIYGKAKGTTWFMNDIILDIYNNIS